MALKKNKTKKRGKGARDTVIGAGAVLDGTFEIEYDMRVDGTLRSERLVMRGALVVGVGGQVQAEVIEVGEVRISGEVNGRLTASESVHISAGARFKGTLFTPRLVLEEGAKFVRDES
jgi:cytoskeletal protein CcmA (bactofilin family)